MRTVNCWDAWTKTVSSAKQFCGGRKHRVASVCSASRSVGRHHRQRPRSPRRSCSDLLRICSKRRSTHPNGPSTATTCVAWKLRRKCLVRVRPNSWSIRRVTVFRLGKSPLLTMRSAAQSLLPNRADWPIVVEKRLLHPPIAPLGESPYREAGQCTVRLPVRVKKRRTQCENMFSGLPCRRHPWRERVLDPSQSNLRAPPSCRDWPPPTRRSERRGQWAESPRRG
jgi:hypothetical protein